MSCFDYIKDRSLDSEDTEEVISSAYEDGYACMLKYHAPCASRCGDRSSEDCWKCLSSEISCPSSSDPTVACCPYSKYSVTCSDCLANNDNDLTKCLSDTSGLSTGALIGIIIGSIVGLTLIIVGLYFLLRTKHTDLLKTSLGNSQLDDGVINEILQNSKL